MSRHRTTPSYLNFDRSCYLWKKDTDYRKNPELYRVGKGEQGVLICEPYKSEMLPFWHFKTPQEAKKSSIVLFKIFKQYLKNKDFVGADLARKFLQMGFTRARRYANYRGGRKYNASDKKLLPKGTGEVSKAISANIFYMKWQKAEKEPSYKRQKTNWKKLYG